jgi:hypothetical protein
MLKTLLIGLALMVPGIASAQDGKDRRIIVENHTGRTIYQLFGSRVQTRDWENDILGDDVIPDAQHRSVNMFDGTTACRFDFKADFRDGTTMTRTNVNVCAEATLTFGDLRHGHDN